MPKFLTQFDPHDRVHVNPGDPIKTLYGPIFDKQGRMQLKEIGQHDLYSEIQSHADSVDIHVLLKMYEQGDVSVFSRIQGAYGDFTQMPKTFAEALNVLIAAEQYFNGLPVDVRAKFGHDFNRFVATMDQPGWAADIGIDLPTPPVASQSSSDSVPPTPTPTPTPPSETPPAAS